MAKGGLLVEHLIFMASLKAYFVRCCLLKIKIVILRIRRILDIFSIYEQVRELNYQSFKVETGLLHMLKHWELFDDD